MLGCQMNNFEETQSKLNEKSEEKRSVVNIYVLFIKSFVVSTNSFYF